MAMTGKPPWMMSKRERDQQLRDLRGDLYDEDNPPADIQTQTKGIIHNRFGKDLEALITDSGAGDCSAEAVWQGLALVIARRWQQFSAHQSPLSTFNMLCKCCDQVLKLRLAARRAQGDAGAGQELAQFQAFMAEVMGDADTQGGEQGVSGTATGSTRAPTD